MDILACSDHSCSHGTKKMAVVYLGVFLTPPPNGEEGGGTPPTDGGVASMPQEVDSLLLPVRVLWAAALT